VKDLFIILMGHYKESEIDMKLLAKLCEGNSVQFGSPNKSLMKHLHANNTNDHNCIFSSI
jgi:hypothetical protein